MSEVDITARGCDLVFKSQNAPDGTRRQRSYGIFVIAGVASEGAADPNAPVLEFWRLAHHDQGSARNAIVEVDHVDLELHLLENRRLPGFTGSYAPMRKCNDGLEVEVVLTQEQHLDFIAL